jgi:hypothetical protein
MNKQLLKTYFLIAFVALAVIGYAQQKQNAKPEATKAPATAELKAEKPSDAKMVNSKDQTKGEKAPDSKSEAYNPEIGRQLSIDLAKKYIDAYPGYEKLCTLNADKKNYTDKNPLELILKLNQKYDITDEFVTQLLAKPENQKKYAAYIKPAQKNEPKAVAPLNEPASINGN